MHIVAGTTSGEHRRLKLSQLERLRDPDRYIYTENCSKNHTGTFNQLHVQSKVVPVHCTCSNAATADLRCHVHLLDTYISKLPLSVVTGMHLSFQNLTGCTVNVYQTPAATSPLQPKNPVHSPPYDRGISPFSDLSKTDLELLIKDLESD